MKTKFFEIAKSSDRQTSKAYGFTIDTGAIFVWQFAKWDCKIRGQINIGKKQWQFALFLTEMTPSKLFGVD